MAFSIVWSADGVLVIAIAAPPSRPEARTALRSAVRQAAAQWLSIDIDSISVESSPGQAPSLLLAGDTVGLSISHDEGLSLAAIHLHGKVGLDVMRVVQIPDWEIVARDYLGPSVAASLAACSAIERPLALAQAWTAREATLKYAGLQLAEWSDAIFDCRLQTLPVALPYVATLAC
ncbi:MULTISPECIES: 4'-phosphopantetheinyl transferase superfamily protein [unclassified Janthinobacterium]|uniref:4'-phosphopantetheinyl transferase family protein n=1 Tax=unclassified Janthinobacterium TaxID=2610881 RepID=UPI001612740F|nr:MULTISPECIES: 4'-phosphopantetheinyl transferase superfamily protein [unclassified Janthinobacterium]MBB5610669.1 4'-phosphopantetheinyl transferase [Janthinobacterium sp. S3T4]MBB5616155.1 4'-phosphopantetheinyl transferase [Janthinobacterium sp. S3M3]